MINFVSACHASRRATQYLAAASAWQKGLPAVRAPKELMARHARALMLRIAALADLPAHGKVTTRFNAGGPAVSGELYLSATGIHAWIEVSCVLGAVLTMRTRSSTGVDGNNHTVTLDSLTKPACVIATVDSMRELARVGRGV